MEAVCSIKVVGDNPFNLHGEEVVTDREDADVCVFKPPTIITTESA